MHLPHLPRWRDIIVKNKPKGVVWIGLKLRLHFQRVCLFFFFLFHAVNVDFLFTNPQISFFSNFFIKNGSYGTIYIFKNYFATMFSVFSFQFKQNKFYPNRMRNLLTIFCFIDNHLNFFLYFFCHSLHKSMRTKLFLWSILNYV